MKGLKTLIKLQKKELDERARKKAEYETQILRLQANINTLQDELEKEQQLVSSMPEMAFMFMSYAEGNKQRQQQLQQTIVNIQRKVQAIEEQMRVHFGELKKYEIALEQKIKKQAIKEKLLEDKNLSDIAINNYMRKETE